ncbi:hypothetical protein LCGC14_0462570 [marine sediment metagenome]|uniref:Uncharacterized protein n=1 Tax=marine sediment metagenome TaxID=412755 RepID=A0A0F9VNP9_9ZZZZ
MRGMGWEYHEWFGGWWLFTDDFTTDWQRRIYRKEMKLNLEHQKIK